MNTPKLMRRYTVVSPKLRDIALLEGTMPVDEAMVQAEAIFKAMKDEETCYEQNFQRYGKWLSRNYRPLLRDSETEMVVKVGTRFWNNSPILRLIPRREISETIKYDKLNTKPEYLNSTQPSDNGKSVNRQSEAEIIQQALGLYRLLESFGVAETIYGSPRVRIDGEKAPAAVGALNSMLGLYGDGNARLGRRNGISTIILSPNSHSSYRNIVKALKPML